MKDKRADSSRNQPPGNARNINTYFKQAHDDIGFEMEKKKERIVYRLETSHPDPTD